jgi:hypothetical protein
MVTPGWSVLSFFAAPATAPTLSLVMTVTAMAMTVTVSLIVAATATTPWGIPVAATSTAPVTTPVPAIVGPYRRQPKPGQHVGRAVGMSIDVLGPGVLTQPNHRSRPAGRIGDGRARIQLPAIDGGVEREDDGHARDRQVGGPARLHHQRFG